MAKGKLRFCLIAFMTVIVFSLGCKAPLWAASAEEERVAKLIEGARKEGNLVWYTIMDVAEAVVMIKRFETKYPFLKVELVRLNVPRLLTRVLAETGAKTYKVDVISTQGFPFWVMKRKGVMQKYLSPQSAFYPEGAIDPDGYGTSVYLTVKTLGYHTKLVPPQDVPKTYEALLDPKWKGGKLCVDTDIYEWFGNMLKILGRQKGLDLMKKIAQQQPQVRTGNTLRATLLGAGEFAVAIAVNADGLERMKAKGAQIGWTYPEPIVTLQHMAGVLGQAAHPNAAKLFIDFMLSKEGQEVIRDVRRVPTRPDVDAVPPISVRGMKLHYSDHSIADIYNDITREYDDLFVKKK